MTLTNEELDKARAEHARRLADFTTLNDAEWHEYRFDMYRELVRTDWTPAPVVDPLLDALNEAFKDFRDPFDQDEADEIRQALASRGLKIVSEDKAESVAPPAMSRDYRAGIEAAIEWVAQHTMVSYYRRMDMRRDLLGGAGQ